MFNNCTSTRYYLFPLVEQCSITRRIQLDRLFWSVLATARSSKWNKSLRQNLRRGPSQQPVKIPEPGEVVPWTYMHNLDYSLSGSKAIGVPYTGSGRYNRTLWEVQSENRRRNFPEDRTEKLFFQTEHAREFVVHSAGVLNITVFMSYLLIRRPVVH